MRTNFLLVNVLCFVGLSMFSEAYGAVEKEGSRFRVNLTTRDGSKLNGVLGMESFLLASEIGDVQVPIQAISRIQWQTPGSPSLQVFFRNGDRLTGGAGQDDWLIETAFGPLAVSPAFLKEVVVLGPVRASKEGLLFWNQLGSDEEIMQSAQGPGGIRRGGRFVPGVEGSALEARWDESGVVTFAQVPVNGAEGCMEIWARFSSPPARLSAGANPFLFRLTAGGANFDIALTGNNGNGFAGISGVADWLGVAGTGAIGDWSYDSAIGGSARDWHHFALVWKKEGIEESNTGRARVAVYVDGRLNSTRWVTPETGRTPEEEIGSLTLMINHHMDSGSVALDEIKIWNYAKAFFPEITRARTAPTKEGLAD